MKENQIDFTPFPHRQFSGKNKEKIGNEIEKWQELRKQILETFSFKPENVDTKRVAEFMASLELPLREYVFLTSEEDLDTLFTLFENCGVEKGDAYTDKDVPWEAMCEERLNLILIRTDSTPDIESIDENLEIETVLVHELAHGTSGYSGCVVGKTKLRINTDGSGVHQPKETRAMPRLGFSVGIEHYGKRGSFLEESWADLIAGMYHQEYMPIEIQKELLKFTDTPDRGLDGFIAVRQGEIELPAKYFALCNGGLALRYTGIAAYGLELLCKEKPVLFETLVRGRTDINALREIPKIIDTISPGLYGKLNQLRYHENDFIYGLQMIQKAIEESKQLAAA